jgi:hypothetical protein
MEIPNCANMWRQNNFVPSVKILLSNQNFRIMKKFGIIVVLAMFALGVSAQEEANHHHPILKGNTANLNQAGFSQWGFIFQFGDNNNANINQGMIPTLGEATANHDMGSYGNTAFITQIGYDNLGTINQTGHGNLANLWQLNYGWYHGSEYAELVNGHPHAKSGATGTITQTGNHNIASVLQLSGSNINILQGGAHNYIGGAWNVNFCGHLENYTYQQSCNPNFMFAPLVVGENQSFDASSINQTGEGEFFFGIGVLKGTRTITQGNNLSWASANHHHHSHLDYNAIWLSQEGGNAVLSQNGRYNKIWLDIDVKHHNSPSVTITQTGIGNKVAKFNGPCDNCASGPAEFNGDKMMVTQTGFGNRLSVESDGAKNVINVTQTGMYNFGMIVQKGIHHQNMFQSYCAGCQQ